VSYRDYGDNPNFLNSPEDRQRYNRAVRCDFSVSLGRSANQWCVYQMQRIELDVSSWSGQKSIGLKFKVSLAGLLPVHATRLWWYEHDKIARSYFTWN
jgi:hypothetical protein